MECGVLLGLQRVKRALHLPPAAHGIRHRSVETKDTKGLIMASATARHILVKTVEEAIELKGRIDGGESFEEMAKLHSTCPSGKKGGSLGEFSPGQMVKEFDTVVFGDLPVGQVSEPIETQFGFHLIEVEKRIG